MRPVQPKNAFGQCTVKILPHFGLTIRPDKQSFYGLGHIMSIHVLLRGFFLSYIDCDKKYFTLIIIPKR